MTDAAAAVNTSSFSGLIADNCYQQVLAFLINEINFSSTNPQTDAFTDILKRSFLVIYQLDMRSCIGFAFRIMIGMSLLRRLSSLSVFSRTKAFSR